MRKENRHNVKWFPLAVQPEDILSSNMVGTIDGLAFEQIGILLVLLGRNTGFGFWALVLC